MGKALVIVCHGSKSKKSSQEIKSLLAKIKKINQNIAREKGEVPDDRTNKENYFEIAAAFLEFADPQLEKTVQSLYQNGIKNLDILPLFIFAGYHLCQDLPQRLEKLEVELTGLNYKILNHPAHYDDFASYIFDKALSEISKT
ncbi:CbiX protein [Halanaerobium saccharolyticum]|jgi:sirohydrochlorin ferrochelatase|uniref:CbiX protein n=1 Tax=Halanaerobium saccharolyticum TaxID=43595 RepID=A0A2T5RLI2_9FIRM|nr:CbiX/SirB N-terminal domain-containing protein [Halanaerobium saccharolyticum]PTW00112.1 CbiX protein [Halanaerobium saccharolyticum]